MTTYTISTISKLVPTANNGAAGDIFLLADGTHDHPSREALSKSGVIVRAQNKGKAIIKGQPIDITGSNIEFSGFELQYSSTEQQVVNLKGSGYKFLDNKCRFGNPISTRNDWIFVKANNGLIQGNDIGNKVGLGNMILVGASNFITNTKILGNKLHDMSGGSGNGAEIVRFGSSSTANDDFKVEFANNEVYNHNTSDAELITVKSSGNDLHDNIFRNCIASPCFRHGRLNKFRNNKLEGVGLRIYGRGHEVTGNSFKKNSNKQLFQIIVGNGKYAEEELNTEASYTQVRDLVFANNTIENADGTDDIIFCFGYGSYPLKPINNKVTGNTITASKGRLASTRDGSSWSNNTVSGNIMWATGSATYGDMPTTGYTKKDPSTVTPPTPIPPTPTPEPEPTPEPVPPEPTMTIEQIIADHERRISALENAA